MRNHADRIGTVLQSYLYRCEDDVNLLLADRIRIRLCKGAYKEPPTLAFPAKADVDANYLKLTKILLTSGVFHGLATHDEVIIRETKKFVEQEGIDRRTLRDLSLEVIDRACASHGSRDGRRTILIRPPRRRLRRRWPVLALLRSPQLGTGPCFHERDNSIHRSEECWFIVADRGNRRRNVIRGRLHGRITRQKIRGLLHGRKVGLQRRPRSVDGEGQAARRGQSRALTSPRCKASSAVAHSFRDSRNSIP